MPVSSTCSPRSPGQEEKALFFGCFFRHLPLSLNPWKGKSSPPSLPPSLVAHYAHRLPLFRTRLLASFSFSPPSLCAVIYWLTVDFPPPPPMFSPVSKFGIWHLLPRAQGLFFIALFSHCFATSPSPELGRFFFHLTRIRHFFPSSVLNGKRSGGESLAITAGNFRGNRTPPESFPCL